MKGSITDGSKVERASLISFRKKVIFSLIFISIVLLALFWWIFFGKASVNFIQNIIEYYNHDDRDITSPLTNEVASDLCNKFELSENDWRCTGEKPVYAFDFFGYIQTYINELPQEKKNLLFIQSKINKYEYIVEEYPNGENRSPYYSHLYDFNGDRLFPLGILFDVNGNVIKIFTNIGRDSG